MTGAASPDPRPRSPTPGPPWRPAPWCLVLRFDIEHEETIRYLGTDAGLEREVDEALGLLAEAGAAGNFAVVAETARKFPAAIRRIAGAGHGVIGHGRAHRPLGELGRAAQAAELRAMREALGGIAGTEVLGFAPPHDSTSAETPAAGLEAGLRFATWCAGAPRGPAPAPVPVEGFERPLWVMVPRNEPRNGRSDWSHLRAAPPWNEPPWDPGRARREWSALLASARERAGMVHLIAHPWMFGANEGERSLLLDLLAQARASGAWIGTYNALLERLERNP